MAKRLLVFQHSPWEGPGEWLLQAARLKGINLEIVRLWEEGIPEITGYSGLLVLGGSPNVDQEKQFPFLAPEKIAIRQAVDADLPCLGICLGHQLLAHVLGAQVGPNSRASVGFINGYLTHEGRQHQIFSGLPDRPHFFKWHGQAVIEPLPEFMTVLATSADCRVEAISIQNRPHILGIQFDNHAAHPRDVESWLINDAKWLASLDTLKVDPAVILADARRLSSVLEAEFTQLIMNFFCMLRACLCYY